MTYKTEQLEYFKRRREILVFYRDVIQGLNPPAGSDLEKALNKIEAELAKNQEEAKAYLIFPFRTVTP